MTPKEVLIAAKALIDTPEKWAHSDRELLSHKHCAVTALGFACSNGDGDWDTARLALKAALPDVFRGQYMSQFNDDPSITHTDVMAWFDRAIEAAS